MSRMRSQVIGPVAARPIEAAASGPEVARWVRSRSNGAPKVLAMCSANGLPSPRTLTSNPENSAMPPRIKQNESHRPLQMSFAQGALDQIEIQIGDPDRAMLISSPDTHVAQSLRPLCRSRRVRRLPFCPVSASPTLVFTAHILGGRVTRDRQPVPGPFFQVAVDFSAVPGMRSMDRAKIKSHGVEQSAMKVSAGTLP
jgi:hypothetical protein